MHRSLNVRNGSKADVAQPDELEDPAAVHLLNHIPQL